MVTDRGFRRIHIPGKTFLLGEYLAMIGGPSIVAASAPAFCFRWREIDGDVVQHPFHLKSPAGGLLGSAGLNGRAYQVEFDDPYGGIGGFGASTAEFLGAWMFLRALRGEHEILDVRSVDQLLALLEEYKRHVPLASGADLVSQMVGGTAVWDRSARSMRVFHWPFKELRLSLVHTGKKLNTHEHLSGATAKLSASGLETVRGATADAIASFESADSERFVLSVRKFADVLHRERLVADHTEHFLKAVRGIPGVRAAKGCGAMGFDVIAILHDGQAMAAIEELVRESAMRRYDFQEWSEPVRVH